jgi:hypothetical protein
MTGAVRTVALLAAVLTIAMWAAPPPAAAVSPTGVICSLGGLVSGVLGKACTLATHIGGVLKAGKKLVGGHAGGVVSTLTGTGVARGATAAVGLAAIASTVIGGARYALDETAKAIGASTSPNLESTWFSASYWRMAAVSALLTLPFLFAAAIQALIRSDLALLARAAFGYLPLGLLAIGVAAPMTMLLLAGSDEMSTIVSSASAHAGTSFLGRAVGLGGGVAALSGSMFVSFLVGLLTASAAIALWIELLIREAAVYVIVLMLPLFFAAMVWPARRVWAFRAVEVLIALILSKFAIVAVLSLGGAALGHAPLPGPGSILAGATLVLLAAFSPWALLRLLPLHELAGAAVGGLSTGAQRLTPPTRRSEASTDAAEQLAADVHSHLLALTSGGSSEARGSNEPPLAADPRTRDAASAGDAGPDVVADPESALDAGAPDSSSGGGATAAPGGPTPAGGLPSDHPVHVAATGGTLHLHAGQLGPDRPLDGAGSGTGPSEASPENGSSGGADSGPPARDGAASGDLPDAERSPLPTHDTPQPDAGPDIIAHPEDEDGIL